MSRLTIQPASPSTRIALKTPSTRTTVSRLKSAIGDRLTRDKQTLFLAPHFADQVSNVLHQSHPVVARHALGRGLCTDVAAQSNDLVAEPNLLADERGQPCDATLLSRIVRRQRRDRRQICRRLRETVFIGREKRAVAGEHESAIPGLDVLRGREQSCEPSR